MTILHSHSDPQFVAHLRTVPADANGVPHSVDIAVGYFYLWIRLWCVDVKAGIGMMCGATCAVGYTLMCHARRSVSDAIWERYAPYLPGRQPGAWGGSYPIHDNRTVLEAVLWIASAGSPWRDLPAEFGKWDTIYQRCRRRCRDGICSDDWFARLAADLRLELDTVMVDGAFAKVHQHGTGAPKADARMTPDDSRAAQAIGVSRGGLTTKIVAMVDKAGRRAGFMRSPGNAPEPHSLPELLAGIPAHELIADKAYEPLVLVRVRG